jgi:tetratricopeptide (TPR) repeat protein
MAAAADSSKPTSAQAVQTAPSGAPEAPAIPLPPLPQPGPASPERFLRWVKRFDIAIVAVVLAFAFLVGSFPVYNSDFFMELASGRLLAQGNYHFGDDPYSFTTQGVYWVNHSWLFDLLLYALYSLPGIGGAAVVVAKALLMVLLAGLMISVGHRPGQSLWAPAACTGLALLCLGFRLFLQPVIFSYLFLGLTLFLLRRPRQLREESAGRTGATPGRNPYLAYWLIPVVCAFWVNLDAWFLLGPITVGLYLLGETLQDRLAPAKVGPDAFAPGEQKTLLLVFLASIAACLINPHHVHALTLPYQLGLTGVPPELAGDLQFRVVISPFETLYFHPTFGLSVAGLAYFPLLFLGVVSFVCALGQWRWWRAVLWLAFALLSAYHVRGVSFFAVVAAPITALNFLDFAARYAGASGAPEGLARRLALPGRFATLLVGLVLLAAAVPGWLQGQPYENWRLGWRVEPNPGLVQAVETIKQLQGEGKLPTGTVWFNTAPEVAYYFAWYCPGERTFLDRRLPLFEKAAADYMTVRKALSPREVVEDEAGGRRDLTAWRKVFDERGIKYLIHFDSSPGSQRQQLTWFSLLSFREEWLPLLLNGRVGVFGWKDPKEPGDPLKGLRLDFDRLAFGPNLPEANKAPRERPAHDPEPREWWSALWKPEVPRPLATDESWLLQLYFEMMGPTWQQKKYFDSVSVQTASAAGLGSGWGGAVVNGALYQARFFGALVYPGPGAFDNFANRATLARMPFQDAGPPAALYLALRAARRAAAANPDDAQAYLRLAQAYFTLHNRTREAQLTGQVFAQPGQLNPNIYLLLTGQPHPALGPVQPYVHLVRQVQLAAALNHALKLDPDLEQGHNLQALLYEQMGYKEAELKARQEYLRCLKTKPPVGVPLQAYTQQVTELDKSIKELEKRVKNDLDQYEINTAGKNVREKAAAAFQAGLVDTALKVLLEADKEDLYETANNATVASGVRLLYTLLLTTGRIEETRDSLSSFQVESSPIFGGFLFMPAYDWFHILIAAAAGDYKAADERVGQVLELESGNRSLTATLLHWDVVPNTPKQMEATYDLPTWTAMMVGHILLAEAPTAAGMPFQLLKQYPSQLQPPHQPRLVPSAWPFLLRDTVMTTTGLIEPKAETLLLRAALALEAGETGDAKKYLREVIAMTGGRTNEGGLTALPSRPLAVQWLGWLEAYPD